MMVVQACCYDARYDLRIFEVSQTKLDDNI